MRVVWVPHPGLLNEYKGREDSVLAGQTGEYKEVEEKNKTIGVVSGDGSKRSAGAPGKIGDGWAQLLTAKAAIVSRGKQVDANQVALEGVQREAEVGARTVLDILDAEQELLDSQVNLVRAQRYEVVAAYQLKTALGEMTARKLGLPVQYYDPKTHYHEVRDDWVGGTSSGDISDDFNRSRPIP